MPGSRQTKKEMTPGQMKDYVRMMNAAFGGTETRK